MFCTTNTTTNANEIKALTRVESEKKDIFGKVVSYPSLLACLHHNTSSRDFMYTVQYCTMSTMSTMCAQRGKLYRPEKAERHIRQGTLTPKIIGVSA